MNRINWIDWSKAIAITMVVFGHMPMEESNYLIGYITTFHMPLFFFISGYLTKTSLPIQAQLKKYISSLVWPYIIYNLVFYPYWIVRYYIDNNYQMGPIFNWTIKPFCGVLLLQYESDFSCNLNGVTWFIAALIFMKVFLDLANRWRYGKYLVYILATLCIAGYTTNEQILFTKNLTPIGFMKCFPFYILGYKIKSNYILNDTNLKSCCLQVILGFIISNIAFIAIRQQISFTCKIILFYVICISAIFFILAICRLLDGFHSKIIQNISIGTLMIMGLHWMAIGSFNFIISRLFINGETVLYTTHQALLLSISIEALIYLPICWSIKHMPLLIGKRMQNIN